MSIHIGIDVGGTFTDLAVSIPGENRSLRHKLPSTPDQPDRAIVDGIAAILEAEGLAPEAVARLSHGTTVGTNALIQRRCGKMAMVTTAGFRDLLEIGRQTRPRMYDLHLDHPPPLVPRRLRFEVRERRRADGAVHVPLDEDGVRAVGRRLAAEGVDGVAVCFLHAYAYPDHEARAADILREVLPDTVHVLPSYSVYPEFREYERFSTAVLNGALRTVMAAYLDRFTAAVARLGVRSEPKVSQSAGGLMSIEMARELPIRACLSGPAAGVAGAAHRAAAAGLRDVLTLDMGGTSTDVSLLHDGVPAEVRGLDLAGFPLRLPALDVHAVGAGGGSIAWIDRDGLLKVGPDSAGATPGPACYDQGGEQATVTDANVVLGRLNGEALLDGRMPINSTLAEAAVGRLAVALGLGREETALGIVRVASATIVKAIRTISVERGHDPGSFALFAFGGAGPLHAVEVARELGIARILVPANPGILCAEGLLNSNLRADFVRTVLTRLDGAAHTVIGAARDEVAGRAAAWFAREAVPPADQRLEWATDLRYKGQNYEISVPIPDAPLDAAGCQALAQGFHTAHDRTYGFASPAEPVQIVNLKVKAVGVLEQPPLPRLEPGPAAEPASHRPVCFVKGRWHEVPIFRRETLAVGHGLDGPAVIEQLDATTLIFPGQRYTVDGGGNLVIEDGEETR